MNQQVQWMCPRCDRVMLQAMRPRDSSGTLLKHCGCRAGKGGRRGTGRFGDTGPLAGSPEYKRLSRIMGLPGFKPVRHDAHVKVYLSVVAERTHSERKCQELLHDAHVVEAKRCPRVWWHIRWKHSPSVARNRQRRRAVQRELLSDAYITRLFTGGRKSDPISAGIPLALIELKRTHLNLRRYLNLHEGEDE